MPDINLGKTFGILSADGEYKPGDPPPTGYCAWHAWAQVQTDAGLRQTTCADCGKWKFPQELSAVVRTSTPRDRDGNVVTITAPVCKACETKGAKDDA